MSIVTVTVTAEQLARVRELLGATGEARDADLLLDLPDAGLAGRTRLASDQLYDLGREFPMTSEARASIGRIVRLLHDELLPLAIEAEVREKGAK